MFLGIVLVVLGVLGIPGAAPTGAQPASGTGSTTPKFLKLTIDSVTPNTVTTSTSAVLVIVGTVTNIGDRNVDDISVRVQRGAAIGNPGGLRSSLRPDQSDYDVVTTPFQDVADELTPGQRKQFTLRIGVRPGMAGAGNAVTGALDISDPGVYPVLLNVNGQPAYGGQARLDDARFLVPILGLPAIPDGDAKGSGLPPVPAPPDTPVATTLLWPLADRPRLVAGIPGSVDGRALLTDDELAGELATGGRLDQLLAALESVLHPDTGLDPSHTGPGLASALCLAIDPDLLITVSAMTDGYRVLASPSDPDGSTRDGSGAHAAKTWLDRLHSLAGSMCTVALPFAQADPTALAAVHDPGVTARAIDAPADIVDSILSIKSVRGVALPTAGSIDGDAATLLSRHGYTSTILADNAVSTPDAHNAAVSSAPGDAHSTAALTGPEADTPELVQLPAPPPAPGSTPAVANPPGGAPAAAPPATAAPSSAPAPTAPPVAGTPAAAPVGLKAATFDIWSATALAAVGSNPPTPSFTPERVRYDVNNDSRAARLQDALAALSWSAVNPQSPRRSALLAPPQQWSANRDEATALLNQVELLIRNGLATPRSFQDLLAQPADPRPFDVNYLAETADEAVPAAYDDPVRDQGQRITDLMGALVEVPQQEPTPRTFLTPLRDDLVRALSLSDRNATGEQGETAARRRLDQTTHTMDGLYRSVTVLPPGGVYTLASEQSPLLLVARNDLPVAVRIRFKIDAPAEATITDIGEQQLPAEGTRSFQIPTQVSDKRNLVIPISLTTPGSVPLGNATSVSVRSNAYGQALAIITACAGALLLLLAGRRLWRRFRGQPDPADEGLDPGKRRRVNRYGRARTRATQRQEAR
ncbi:hypothetical protein [Nocardia sp. BMG111209]|uniref:hypothetical protein n=1 Tax=Nocardia sp. BMG111209 TaxID=1160137 RepID=UPI0003625F53|nr:hypothetical protein [Nocardia sp. BMG111209]